MVLTKELSEHTI